MFGTDLFKKEDEKELAKLEIEVNKKINITGDVARVCLGLVQFAKYRETYEKAEKVIVDTLLCVTKNFERGHINFETYGTKMLVYMTRLKAARALLDTINNDSKKGLEDAKRINEEDEER